MKILRLGGNRLDLLQCRKFGDVFRELGAGEIRAGEVLGQEPLDLREIPPSQIPAAQLVGS
jgi:hypothetical protein